MRVKSGDKFIKTVIVVEGSGLFPFDMLRYDSCALNHGDLAGRDLRKVTLRRFTKDGKRATHGRWISFGWIVIEDSGSN